MEIDWGAVATAAWEGVQSMSAGSEARAGSKEEWRAKLEQTRMQIAGQTMLGQQMRNYQLEDRAWVREQVENYVPDENGNLRTPAPIATRASAPDVPADLRLASEREAAKPPKKKKKRGGFLSRLFG